MDTQWIPIAPTIYQQMDLGEAKMAELRPAQQNHLLRRRAAEVRGKNGGVRRVTTLVHDKRGSFYKHKPHKKKKHIKGISTGHFRMVLYSNSPFASHWILGMVAGWGQDCWQNCLVILWTYQRWTSVDSIGRIIWHTKSHRIKFKCLWTKLWAERKVWQMIHMWPTAQSCVHSSSISPSSRMFDNYIHIYIYNMI